LIGTTVKPAGEKVSHGETRPIRDDAITNGLTVIAGRQKKCRFRTDLSHLKAPAGKNRSLPLPHTVSPQGNRRHRAICVVKAK